MIRRSEERYQIESELLICLLEGREFKGLKIHGYTGNFGHTGFARYALERLCKFAFNIQRFPGYEDRIFSSLNLNYDEDEFLSDVANWPRFFTKVSEMEIDKAIQDLRALYRHTQQHLKELETIIGYRALRPSEYLQFVDRIDELDPSDEVFLRTNTIVSFSVEANRYAHYPIKIRMEIPVRNILMHYRFVETDRDQNGLFFEKEILYLNTDPKAIMPFYKKDIVYLNRKEARKRDEYNGTFNPSITYNGTYYRSSLYDQTYFVQFDDCLKHILKIMPPRLGKKILKELNKTKK